MNVVGRNIRDLMVERKSIYTANADFAALTSVEATLCTLRNANFRCGAVRNTRLNGVNFNNCNMQGSTFDYVIARDCHFVDVNFDNTTLTNSAFRFCTFTNYSFKGADWYNALFLRTAFHRCFPDSRYFDNNIVLGRSVVSVYVNAVGYTATVITTLTDEEPKFYYHTAQESRSSTPHIAHLPLHARQKALEHLDILKGKTNDVL